MTPEGKLLRFLEILPSSDREGCIAFYNDHKEAFHTAPGSFTKHQAWEGGYLDHIVDTFEIVTAIYESLAKERTWPFPLSDAYLALFWHDVEKLEKYISDKKFESENDKLKHVLQMMKKYNIVITEELKNAILYVHGEGKMYSPFENIQKPLAALIHCADTLSARVWVHKK